jgi:hypothetical protein
MSTATFSHSAHFLSNVREMFAGWFDTRNTTATRPLTRFEEAEQLRAMADDLVSSDPAFAQDLYAAADRHELG